MDALFFKGIQAFFSAGEKISRGIDKILHRILRLQ